MNGRRSGLLVSVRSAAEAEAALAGGADLIDVKEPSRGSLGRADDETIAAVVQTVAGRVPVSAAMGELRSQPPPLYLPGIHFCKWGLAGCVKQPARIWRRTYFGACAEMGGLREVYPFSVPVAYADCGRANAPSAESVFEIARESSSGALLLDTFEKDDTTLLDWLTIPKIALICRLCRNAGIQIALAGSLGPDQIVALRHLQPDWFAVRGAACRQGQREGTIDVERVRDLVALLDSAVSPARCES